MRARYRRSAAPGEVKKPGKYKNTKIDGYDSKRERNRGRDLKLMRMAGEIQCLREQVKYELIPAQRDDNGKLLERAVSYIADFVYQKNGQTIVEDAKGMKTPVYILKRKLMLWTHGIRVVEV